MKFLLRDKKGKTTNKAERKTKMRVSVEEGVVFTVDGRQLNFRCLTVDGCEKRFPQEIVELLNDL